MATDGSEQDRIQDEAIDLMIRLHNDPQNPIALDMVRKWRERSDQHNDAWKRVERLHGASFAVLAGDREGRNPQVSRRTVLLGGFGLVGAGAASALWGPEMLIRMRADYMTAAAELVEVTLPYGDTSVLGPKSAIAIRETPERRGVELLTGMAYFSVGDYRGTGFEASFGNLRARTTQAVFAISEDAGSVEIAVESGELDVSSTGWSERIQPGSQLVVDQSHRVEPKDQTQGVAPWKERRVVVENISIAALSSRIGRWLPGRVVLADPFIADIKVSGVFDLNDPMQALRAAVHPAGANILEMGPLLTVIVPG